jgi:hypothetical protein
MSRTATALASLAAGRCPADETLLHTAMLEGWGSQAYGEEAVLEAVRRAPIGTTHWDVVEGPAGLAIFGDDVAWFADTVDGHLRRIWRLGDGALLPREPAIAVAFDPDLRQARGDVITDAGDPIEVAIGKTVLAEMNGLRVRAFPIRTVRSGDDVAMLLAVYRLGEGPSRTCGFSYAAARARIVNDQVADCRIVRDLAGEAASTEAQATPRIEASRG